MELFRFAKEFCESEIPQIYEVGHYLIDNLISKISMLVGEEEDINFERITKSGKIKTYNFPDLYKKILVLKYNRIPDYSEVEKLHEQRNNYQHGKLSIDHIFHRQYALDYLEKAEKIMKIMGIFGNETEIKATEYFTKVFQNHHKSEIIEKNQELQILCVDSLQIICSHLYGIDIGQYNKDSPDLISSLNFLKDHKDLISPLGITYMEEPIKKSAEGVFSFQKGVKIFIHANCEKSLTITLNRFKFEVGNINKFDFDGKEVQSFNDISLILECLLKRIVKN